MARTLNELLALLENVDEVTLMEVLELTSKDIVFAFADRIEENREKFEEFDDEH